MRSVYLVLMWEEFDVKDIIFIWYVVDGYCVYCVFYEEVRFV